MAQKKIQSVQIEGGSGGGGTGGTNLDGGAATTNYGGTTPITGGTA